MEQSIKNQWPISSPRRLGFTRTSWQRPHAPTPDGRAAAVASPGRPRGVPGPPSARRRPRSHAPRGGRSGMALSRTAAGPHHTRGGLARRRRKTSRRLTVAAPRIAFPRPSHSGWPRLPLPRGRFPRPPALLRWSIHAELSIEGRARRDTRRGGRPLAARRRRPDRPRAGAAPVRHAFARDTRRRPRRAARLLARSGPRAVVGAAARATARVSGTAGWARCGCGCGCGCGPRPTRHGCASHI